MDIKETIKTLLYVLLLVRLLGGIMMSELRKILKKMVCRYSFDKDCSLCSVSPNACGIDKAEREIKALMMDMLESIKATEEKMRKKVGGV